MATKDGLPLVPSDHGERSEQPDTGTAWDDPVISPWILKVSILGLTTAAIFFAIVAVEDPRVLIAKTTAFLTASSAPQDDTREATPIVQSAAEASASSLRRSACSAISCMRTPAITKRSFASRNSATTRSNSPGES